MKAAINRLYGSSAGSSELAKRNSDDASIQRRVLPAAVSHIASNSVDDEQVDGKYRQYLANILSQKFALDRSYAIFLFMGDYDEDPSTWATSPNLIGTHTVFAAMSKAEETTSKARQRREMKDIVVTGSMPLTSMLLAKAQNGELDSMALETVTEYLKENLHWRVAMVRYTPLRPFV